MEKRILIADDHAVVREGIRGVLIFDRSYLFVLAIEDSATLARAVAVGHSQIDNERGSSNEEIP